MESLQIKVQQGTLQGKTAKAPSGRPYFSFEGIPYAKPPVGKLRFADPQEPENWTGVHDATKPGNRCAQTNPYAPEFVGSEDCLYLNVYTPCLPAKDLEKLPVMFFIHGGRLIMGFGDYHRPDYFMEKNVVFVTINYRLNVLGFLALDIPEAPGNVGLKDATLALKWVHRNISNFGGDSNNITIMGESAGSGIATTFLISEFADGLYHKAIFESGSALSDLFMEDDHIGRARNFVTVLDKDLKDPKEIYEFLLTVPIEKLIEAVGICELNKEEINAYFLPVVEKKVDGIKPFFNEFPYEAYRDGKFRKVPILFGIHSHEGALFLPPDFEGGVTMREDLEFYIPKYLFIPRDSSVARNMANGLRSFYLGEKGVCKENLEQYVNMLSDTYFLRDIYMHMDFIAKYHPNMYCYRFAYNGNLNTRVMKNLGLKGASHGDIIAYQFYRKNKADKVSKDDQKIVDFLTEAWTNFAKNGKPSWSGQKMGWLPYTKDERYFLNIDKELTQAVYPERDRIECWKRIMSPRAKF